MSQRGWENFIVVMRAAGGEGVDTDMRRKAGRGEDREGLSGAADDGGT